MTDTVSVVLLFAAAYMAAFTIALIYKKLIFCVFILFYIIGNLSMSSAGSIRNHLAEEAAISYETIEISGIIQDISGTRVLIAAESATLGDRTEINRFNVRTFLETEENLRIGQLITVTGRLVKPDTRRNEGGFDQFQHFAARNIQYRMNATLVSTGGTTITIRGVTNNLKNKLIEIFDNSLPPAESGILKAMLLGDRTGIDERIAELYRAGGIYHILAISGMHITAIAFFLDFLFKKRLGNVNSGMLTFVILSIYAVFTGLSLSVTRAVIMFGVFAIGKVLRRKNDLLSSTALAACILLVINPFNLWDGGFLLSFSSVFGIGFGANTIKQAMAPRKKDGFAARALNKSNFFSNGIPATIAVTLFNTPIVAMVFYQIPVFGIVANLLIVPTVVFVIVGGIFVGISGFISIYLSSFLGGSLFFIFQFYEFLCVLIESLPFAMFTTGTVRLHHLLIWYSMSALILVALKSNLSKRRFYFKCATGAALALIVVFTIEGTNYRTLNYVTNLDVGQGDSIVIRNTGNTFLVDGGEAWNANEILSHLRSRRINKIDGIFVTHSDSDHIGGIVGIIGRIDIGAIYMPPSFGTQNDLETEIRRLASQSRIPITNLSSGDRISFFGGEIEVLNPTLNLSNSRNANSLVLLYETKGVRFLFTGDIGTDEERRITGDFSNIQSHVLNLAHHGSAFSNSELFLQAVSPDIAFVGTGRRNPHGHPAGRVVNLLYEMNIPLYNTAESGQTTFFIEENSTINVRTMR